MADFQGQREITHRIVSGSWRNEVRKDWAWVLMEEEDAAPGDMNGRSPAEVRLLFSCQNPRPRTLCPPPSQNQDPDVYPNDPPSRKKQQAVMRHFAVIRLPDPVNGGKVRNPTGSLMLQGRKNDNIIVVPIEVLVSQAQVVPVEYGHRKPMKWLVNHRIDLATFNHVGAYHSIEDDV